MEESGNRTQVIPFRVRLILLVIKSYKFIYFSKLHSCRFIPTCSNYAVEAIEKRGIALGIFYAVKRILRCYPMSPGGVDPIAK